MSDTFDFIGGILLGTFLGSLATLVYHVRQLRQETRQNYVRLSLAQAEVATLELMIEIHRRNPIADLPQPLPNPAAPESEAGDALPLIPAWIGSPESPIATETTSQQAVSRTGES
jgi:hypothetical protein